MFEHNCNHFTSFASTILLKKTIPQDILDQPSEILKTPLGQLVAPLLQKAQDCLKVQSNPLFSADLEETSIDRPDGAPAGMNLKEEKL
jgi:hypothetical protein